jgi:hypothetical protein
MSSVLISKSFCGPHATKAESRVLSLSFIPSMAAIFKLISKHKSTSVLDLLWENVLATSSSPGRRLSPGQGWVSPPLSLRPSGPRPALLGVHVASPERVVLIGTWLCGSDLTLPWCPHLHAMVLPAHGLLTALLNSLGSGDLVCCLSFSEFPHLTTQHVHSVFLLW